MVWRAGVVDTDPAVETFLVRRRHNHQFTPLCNAACTDAGGDVLMGSSKKKGVLL